MKLKQQYQEFIEKWKSIVPAYSEELTKEYQSDLQQLMKAVAKAGYDRRKHDAFFKADSMTTDINNTPFDKWWREVIKRIL